MRERRTRQPITYGRPSVEKMLGALPVVADYCHRLDLAAIIDRACPIRTDVAILTHGQVIEALVANRLTSPAPLLHVTDWARTWAVEETFDIPAEALNDDRIARALDAIAPELEKIVGSVGAQAITTFGIDVSRLHWDMTSISLHGAYPQTDPDYATPRFGHPKDRRPDLKQVQAGLAVSGDGGIPVFHHTFDGGAGEVNQVVPAMTALQTMAGPRKFLLVGDSKLISYGNVRDMVAAGVEFIAPASKTYVPATVLAGLNTVTATEVGYVAERDISTPEHERGRWRVVEDTMSLAGPRKTDPVASLRRVFVHSTMRAQAAITARAKKLDRARDDLDRLTRGLGSRHYPSETAVRERVTAIGRSRRVASYLRAMVGTDPGTGKPTLAWSFDQSAIDAEAATDGWYALLTTLPVTVSAGEVLLRYKGQEVVERRYSAFKGPLAVAPMFLKTNRRIAALITVICLALLVFCLVERAVRSAITPEVKMPGLVPGQRAKPTGRLVLQALGGLRLIPAMGGQPATIPQPTSVQARLLDLLAVDPTQPP